MSKDKFITNPETIAELKRIYAENDGILLPKTIVDEARDTASPLHRHFQWDDCLAAEAYRIEQARGLLQVVVELIDIDGDKRPVRVFASLSTDRKSGGYRTMVDVVANKSLRKQLIKDALRDIEFFQRKYDEIIEFSGVLAEMSKVKHKLAA